MDKTKVVIVGGGGVGLSVAIQAALMQASLVICDANNTSGDDLLEMSCTESHLSFLDQPAEPVFEPVVQEWQRPGKQRMPRRR